jgi:hypothetical protein
MNCDASSTQGLTRFRGGLILAFALALGVALTSFKHTALAALDGAQAAQGQRAVTLDAQTRGAFVVAKKDDDDGHKNGDKGNDKGRKGGKNANRDKDDGKGHHGGDGDNGHRNGGKNANWDNDGDNGHHGGGGDGDRNWSKNGNGNKGNKNWSKNDNGHGNDDGHRNWSKNGKKYGKGWGGYGNNWNGNWNNRAHVREWNRKPYYGEFIGGVILGSIFAANGIGVVPYAPEPNLCWYWADPYMYRGYWDYCY